MEESCRFTLEHIGIKAKDMDESVTFYSQVLGFELIKRIKPGEVELAFMRLGNAVVELVELNKPMPNQDGLVNHLALKTDDIFRATEHLKRFRVHLLSPEPCSMGEGRYNLFFRGPSGEKLELFQGSF